MKDRIFAVRMIMKDKKRVPVDYHLSRKELYRKLCHSLVDKSSTSTISDPLRQVILEALEISNGYLVKFAAYGLRVGWLRARLSPKHKPQKHEPRSQRAEGLRNTNERPPRANEWWWKTSKQREEYPPRTKQPSLQAHKLSTPSGKPFARRFNGSEDDISHVTDDLKAAKPKKKVPLTQLGRVFRKMCGRAKNGVRARCLRDTASEKSSAGIE